ncbi:MAG: CoA ester lyase [Deltaproteobacteria bacterium]|nr:CoA ester lyase [Deltaproteobacteria bacterium]
MADENVEPTRLRRSMLFVPGADRRKLERAREAGADALILDLEDSVAPEKKADARRLVAEALRAGVFGDREVAVRINPPGTAAFDDDLASVIGAGAWRIMLSKCESASQVGAVTEKLGDRAKLLLLVETPLGVVNAAAIAGAGASVEALCFGSADFSLAMGLGETDASRGIVYHARCTLVIAAKACGVAAIDCAHLAVKDEAAFREDAMTGLRLGFDGKLCIHPRQVEITNAVYTPGTDEIAYARRVVEAWERAALEGRGVFSLDGRMIDAPVVAAQRRVLQRARLAGLLAR